MTDYQTIATYDDAEIVRNTKTRKTYLKGRGARTRSITTAEAVALVRSWHETAPKRTEVTTGVSEAFDKLFEQYLSTVVRQPGPVYKPRPRQRPLSAHQRRRAAAKRARISRKLNRR